MVLPNRDPLRAALTVLAVGIGSAVVTLTIDVGNGLLAASRASFATPGLRMVVATAELDAEKRLRYRTDLLSPSDAETLRRTVPATVAVGLVEGTGSAAGDRKSVV